MNRTGQLKKIKLPRPATEQRKKEKGTAKGWNFGGGGSTGWRTAKGAASDRIANRGEVLNKI